MRMAEGRTETVRGEAVVRPMADLAYPSDLVGGPDGRLLAGSECTACGTRMAGAREVCSTCTSQALETVGLGPDGVLYSFTTIHVSPTSANPYTLGYVDLAQGARVLAPLEGPLDTLSCGQPVRLVVDGDRWAFGPAD